MRLAILSALSVLFLAVLVRSEGDIKKARLDVSMCVHVYVCMYVDMYTMYMLYMLFLNADMWRMTIEFFAEGTSHYI